MATLDRQQPGNDESSVVTGSEAGPGKMENRMRLVTRIH